MDPTKLAHENKMQNLKNQRFLQNTGLGIISWRISDTFHFRSINNHIIFPRTAQIQNSQGSNSQARDDDSIIPPLLACIQLGQHGIRLTQLGKDKKTGQREIPYYGSKFS